MPSRRLWQATLCVVHDTAIEPYALLDVATAWLDLNDGRLCIPRDNSPTGREQSFQLLPETLALLKATAPDERRHLLPWRIERGTPNNETKHGPHNFHAACRELLECAGLPAGQAHFMHHARRAEKLWTAIVAHLDRPLAFSR